jgi:hypothetical protein
VASYAEFEEQMGILKQAIKEVEDEGQNLENQNASALEPLEAAGRKVMESAQACQAWTGNG